MDRAITTADDAIELSPHHDVAAYAAEYAATGRVHIRDFLRKSDVRRLHEALLRAPWEFQAFHAGVKKLPLAQWEALPAGHRQALETALAEEARKPQQFTFRFLTVHLSMDGEAYPGPDPDLQALVRFLNGESFLSFARAITGDGAIRLTDVHASGYRAGDYLHRHNDLVPDAERVAAYILNLTPVWQPEWGGLLNFLGADGHIDAALTPTWNAMNFLRVPQPHFVSTVADFVTATRLSVSGWVRRR